MDDKQPATYEIDSFEKMINIATDENFENLTMDFLHWFHFTMRAIKSMRDADPKKYKNKTNWQVMKSIFIWIDDGKNELTKFQMKDRNTGLIQEIKVKEKENG